MVNCVIVSAGEKIKNLREKYRVKQEDIAGSDITRNLISEIEHNKVKVTRNTAEVILKHLNKLAAERGFNVEETVDYLVEDELSQASKILDQFIEELKTLVIAKDGSFIDLLKDAEGFLINWDIKDKKLKIYELAGDYYCNNNDMYKSAVYYEKASALLSKMFLDRKLIPLSRKLSMVYNYIGDYKKGIECCEFALNCFNDMPQNDRVVFSYNNALNYFSINNFEMSLNNLKIAEEIVDEKDTSTYIKILNSKAVCFYKMKLYKEALQVFTEILDLTDKSDIEKYLVILTNIVDVYMDINMKDKAIENLDMIISQLPNLNDNSLCSASIYFDIGEIYKKLNNLNKSEEYFLKALSISQMQKNYILANNILQVLVDMYIVQNNIKKMEFVKEKVFHIINKQDKVDDRLMYKLIVFYNKINSEVVTQISKFALKFK